MQDPSQTNMDYFRREVQVYEWLSSLQGKYIPKVYGSYEGVEERFGREERFGIVVMEVLTGAFQDDIETVSLEARQKALVALKKVHEIVVLQGDIRVQNFYFGSEKEYLIDFSHSRVSEYGRELNFEEEKAKVCLGLGETTSRRNRPASTREHEMSSMSWLEPNSEPNRGLEWVETLFGFEPKWKESPEITTLTTLARRVLSLPSTSSCSVSFLAAGAFNKLYTIYHSSSESSASELSQDGEQQRVLRVALPVDPKFKVLSEVATLTFLRQFSKLVPEPLEYDDGRDNEVGFEWMLMSKVEGLPIEESWRTLNWEEKERVVNDVVTFLADLFNRRFEGIGSLFCDREGKKESSFKVGRIVSMIFFWHDHLQYPIPRGPFRSSHDWLDTCLSIHHLDAQNIIETCKDDDEVEFARETQKRLVRLRTLLPLLFPPPSNGSSEETALFHADLSWHNLLVSPTLKALSGIVDWECACTLPLWKVCSLPSFLLGREREEEPKALQYTSEETGLVSDLFEEHTREFEQTKLRRFFLEKMEEIKPEWTRVYRNEMRRRDFELAIEYCDNEFCANRVDRWIEAVERGDVAGAVFA
ncbi:hypothetical protein BT69DRAFT_1242283 [Atractiella rhizophila]|nr:hypothetical protein BT69DRAFT_1242283 [Atractiella rhizophila]